MSGGSRFTMRGREPDPLQPRMVPSNRRGQWKVWYFNGVPCKMQQLDKRDRPIGQPIYLGLPEGLCWLG